MSEQNNNNDFFQKEIIIKINVVYLQPKNKYYCFINFLQKHKNMPMKKFTLLLMTCLCFVFTARAQDVCYLLGNDGTFKANHASATLKKQKKGVFAGEARFTNGLEFIVATRLASSENDWNSIQSYCWSCGTVYVGHEKEISIWNQGEKITFGSMGENRLCWVKVWVTDGQGSGKICIYKQKEDDPDSELEAPEDPENPDIDLSTGAHFTITLQEPGSLKQRLTNAVFQTDYDLVDFLTVKGKMGGADIAYLKAQEGLVSQLQYLDLSDVELVYDDQPYYTTTYQKNWGSFGGIVEYQTNIYTLSEGNKIENGESSFSGAVMDYVTYYRRNNLAHAFSGMQYLKQCKLPKTMTGVGESILEGCPLVKVTLPTAPTYIWGEAFYGTKLISIDLPASVEFIGDNAFGGVPLTTIDVSHVTSIGDYCFTGSSLKSITLSNKLKKMSKAMLAGTMITEIAIPSSVTEIGEEAFSGTKLRTVDIPASVMEIAAKTFYGCQQLGSVTMGNGVKKIGAEAFADCTLLSDITGIDNVEEIGNKAFGYFIPFAENQPEEGGVKYIGKVAYKYISGSKLNFKEGTVSIADNFIDENSDASSITSITLPSTLRILGNGCFKNADISSIELPESLEKIGAQAFAFNDWGATGKLRHITIPRKVSFIGNAAFAHTSLVRVNYNAENAMTEIENEESGYYCPFPNSVTRAVIGEGVKTIPPSLFDQCENLVRVQMPSTVEYIGSQAFACSNLEHIDLPSSLKSMDGGAIVGVTSVTAYMKEPFSLPLWPSDVEELMWDEEVKNAIEQGVSYDGVIARSTPFGYQINYAYHIDEEGHLTWGEAFDMDDEYRIPLLQVPNGSLAAYQGDTTWSKLFLKITTFDGASDAKTVEETKTVSVSQNVSEETDLSGSLIGNVYVTLDTEDSGDGYDAQEGCLIINSTTSDEGLAAATVDNADDLTVKNLFNGLIFEVPAGKGSIVIDYQTLGQQVVYVKIGTGIPQQIKMSNRQQQTIPYEVSEPTRIYVYASKNNGNASRKQSYDNDLAAAPRRVAYANDDAVKLYGITINVDKNTTTIMPPSVGGIASDIWYTLDGRRISNPAQKGIYMQGGRKIVVK